MRVEVIYMKYENTEWLFTVPIAHRGLYCDGAPENSRPAYLAAINEGYAIELDVQMSSDKKLFCYHDDNLKRVCGVNRDIRDLTAEEISKLRLDGTDENIMTFGEVLELIADKTPVLIEMKSQLYPGLEELLAKELENYDGRFAVQSFNATMVKRFQKLMPKVKTGVLTTRESSDLVPKIVNFAMHRLWYGLYLKFDFLNMRIEDLPRYGKKLKKFRVICWTAKTNEDIKIAEKYAENVIFEKTVTDLGKFAKR